MGTIEIKVPDGVDTRMAKRVVEQTLEHRGLLVRVSKALAEEKAPLGPGVLAQIGRVDRLWRSIEDRYGLLTRDQVVAVTGGNPDKARAHVANLRRRAGLLGVSRGGQMRFPGFQFTAAGIRPNWSSLTRPLLQAGWDEEDVLLWFAAPTGWLAGRVPADLLDTDPDAVAAAVAEVAPGVW